MMCYRDRSYCGSKVKKHTCGREFTKQDATDAEKWWGGKDYPVAFMEFCEESNSSQLPLSSKSNNKDTDNGSNEQ